MNYKSVLVPIFPDVYKKRPVNRVSNHYLLKFIESKDKFFRLMRKTYNKAYRQAYTLAQKRGLI